MKKVSILIPSFWTFVGEFDFRSVANSVEHCKLFISCSKSLWIAYTYANQSAISYHFLGDVNDFASRSVMEQKALLFLLFV